MDNSNKGSNAMAAGLAGMVIGAGIGAAATRILTDKKTRDMVANSFSEAKDKVLSYAHRISKEARKSTKD